MKIIRLRFENINSLKGKHVVDFDNGVLKDAGLFAITGPIGAGKTTLLDVITLALFNRTPRLGKISLAEITENGVIVTRNTDHANAEVEYESKGKVYRSKWFIGKKRNGGFNDYEMELSEIAPNGEAIILHSKKSSIPDENARLIGLTYEQFERSIILSQGEFSKFLKSGRNDRSRLLEQLTGTQVFREIGIKAFERKREADKAIELKKEALKGADLLPEEAVEKLMSRKIVIDRKLQILTGKTERRSNLASLRKELVTLSVKISEEEQALLKLKELQENSKADEYALYRHERAIPVQPLLLESDNLAKQLDLLKKKIEATEQAIRENRNKLEALFSEVSTITGKDVHSENIEAATTDLRNTVNQFKNSITAELQKKKHIESLLISIREDLHEAYPKQVLKEADKPLFLNGYIAEQKKQLAALVIPEFLETDNASDVLKELTEKIRLFESLERENERYHELHQKAHKDKKYLEDLEKTIITSSETLKELVTKLDVSKAEKDVLIQQQLLQSMIAGLEELRKDLKEGEACPLCGSLDHPYSSGYHGTRSDLEQLLKEKDEEIITLEKQLGALNSELGKRQGEKLKLTEQVTEISGEITITGTAIKTINKHLSFKAAGDKNLIRKEIEHLTRLLTDTNNWVSLTRQIILLERLCAAYVEHATSVTTVNKLNADLSFVYKGNNIDQDVTGWQNQHASLIAATSQLANNLNTEHEALSATAEQLGTSKAALKMAMLKAGFENEEELRTSVIAEQKVKEIRENKMRIENDIARKTGAIESYKLKAAELSASDNPRIPQETLERVLEENKKQLASYSEEKGSITATLDNNIRNIEKFEKLKKELSTLEHENWKWSMLDKLIGDSRGNKFCNIVQDLTIRHLFAHANARLHKLSDRYILIAGDAEKEDIEVIDKYMGNTRRIAKSLSGGESFLVSLALALGLSDLASRNVRLDSLFIDEGFGTLDPETLEIAISTLEKLQAESNKTIGIISHVEALKERIGCQIRINKKSSGFSELMISGN